ncbi:MAG: hypothetical protein EA416_03015 [Trueperaceae bacterium]|nr:MAG: hypothetical protein EA416_03015 [Trueperaceae bacterium]
MLAHDDATGPTHDPVPTDTASADAPTEPLESIWWGGVDVPQGAAASVRVGPARILAQRRAHEWRVYVERDDEWGETREARARRIARADADDMSSDTPVLRASFADSPGHIVVGAAQADRPVVVRPESPLAIQSGETVTLFVSTPVWIALTISRRRPGGKAKGKGGGESESLRLLEVPSERPTDTWFGPNTRTGELCYATRTSGRLDLADVPQRPHRIVTPVRIENKAGDALEFQRVQVPLPLLAVYRDAGGALWTNGVTLTRDSGGDLAAVRVDGSPPRTVAGGVERLSEPRSVVTGSAMVRAFGRLLRGDGTA